MSVSKGEIYSQLFQKILEGEYPINSRLKETDLAQEFGISRTPIREVLLQLAQDGLIVIHPNKGAIVNSLTPDDVEEIYEIRKSLELLALNFSVHRINLNELGIIKQHILNLKDNGSYQEASDTDNDLHRYIVESSNKKRLIAMLNQMFRIMEKFRFISFHDPKILLRVTNEHLNLIDALTKRDLEEAKAILADHLDKSKFATLQVIIHE